jgi:hemolysin activation/secretion protein
MSRIEIGNTPLAGSWRMVTSLDNSGQESTGERQAGINYSLDNPFGLVDFMSLHVQTNAESISTGFTGSVALHYDLPLGYWNFDLDAAAFEYQSRVAGTVVSFDTSGKSDNQSLRVSRLWYRDQSSKSGGRFYLRRKKNLNFIEDVMLETSSRTLASAGLEAWYQRNISQGGWNISLAYDQGLDALGAQNDDGRLPAEPRAEFSKVRLNAGYYRRFSAGIPLDYSARLNGQHSRDILYSLEQISIGSPYSVRGYKEQGASGNKGAWLRQELGGSLPASPGWLYDTFGVWELALGVDWGKVRDLVPGQESYTELKGWGLGLHSRGGSWNLSVEWAKAWDAPELLPVADHDFYFSLGYSYQPEP